MPFKTIFLHADNKKQVESLSQVSQENINIRMVINIEEVVYLFKKKVIRDNMQMVENLSQDSDRTSAAQSGITDKHLEKLTEKANLLSIKSFPHFYQE